MSVQYKAVVQSKSPPWKNSKFCKLGFSCHTNGLLFKEKNPTKTTVNITSVP